MPEPGRLSSRLREILKSTPSGGRTLRYVPDVEGFEGGGPVPDPERTASRLPGAVASRSPAGNCLVLESELPSDHIHGRIRMEDAARRTLSCRRPLDVLRRAWPRRDPGWPRAKAEDASAFRRADGDLTAAPDATGLESLLFVDIETTGLNGGAGTHAFLVGCGFFEEGAFQIRQYFLGSFSDEHRLLTEIAKLAAEVSTIVSFNGRTFDVPVMETRYLFHRLPSPFEELPHADMLHPARRLWKRRPSAGTWYDDGSAAAAASCTLEALERDVLGFERQDDIQGFEIPSRDFHYVRTGDTAPLEPVFRHNRLDLLSLAALTSVIFRLVDEGPDGRCDGRECLELGRLYERAGLTEQAIVCYRRAADRRDAEAGAEALHALATRLRRDGRHAEAAEAWQRLLESCGGSDALRRQAAHALAVHHEHRSRDLGQAKGFALRGFGLEGEGTRRAAYQHRLARLDRKIARRVQLL